MKNLELFYVDPDYDDRRLFKAAAEHLGHHVVAFQSTQSLLEALENTKPDVIFMELYMPTFNSVKIINYLKEDEAYCNIPIVMVSCIYPREVVSHLLMAGVNFLLKKPSVAAFECGIEKVLEIDLRCPVCLN